MILRRALNQAVKWGILARNPASSVDPPRAEQHASNVSTPSEARSFLSAVQGHRLEGLFTVAVAVGLRLGECLGLRWQDVDLTDTGLRVSVQLQSRDGKPVLTEPKTTRVRRRIPLPSFAVAAMQKHRQQQELERLAIGPAWNKGDSCSCPMSGRRSMSATYAVRFRSSLRRQTYQILGSTNWATAPLACWWRKAPIPVPSRGGWATAPSR